MVLVGLQRFPLAPVAAGAGDVFDVQGADAGQAVVGAPVVAAGDRALRAGAGDGGQVAEAVVVLLGGAAPGVGDGGELGAVVDR